jgi:large subunit ribosomal protein L25
MAGERVKLEVQEREIVGSRDTRRLRKQGIIPGVLYGQGREPVALAVEERELRRVLTGAHGLHQILDVVGGGKATPAVLKEYQRDPVRGYITHFDLQAVRLDQAITGSVMVELEGEAAGSKEGGVLSQVTREINISALPLEMPDRLTVDVTGMHIGDTLRLSDIAVPEGATFLDDPEETVLATVTQPTREEEPDEVTEEGEDAGAGIPSGEQAPEGGADAPLEPEADAAGDQGTVPG